MNLLFKALNDSTRREILEILRINDSTAGEIADRFNMSKPSISHHLDLLRQADLVSSKKKGQFILYTININTLDTVFNWFLQFKYDASIEKPRVRLQLNN
jgi:ArsR family transcriptional regulator, arsenate/arsenite/antimonite-responsive transcriptional repressor